MEIEPKESIKIFYCYAREDQILRDELEKHLTPLKRSGKIVTWCDREILPGTEWESKISQELNTADLILLLVSPDFICSDYCYGNEMKRAYERYKAGEAWVIPIIIRPVLWKDTVISKFQLLPVEGKPVTKWLDRDEAFEHIAQGIDRVVEALLVQKALREQGLRNSEQRRLQTISHLFKEKHQPVQYRSLERRTLLHKRYLIQRLIGEGGMGAVYQAKDLKRQGAVCAIKEMSLSLVVPEEQAQAIQNFKTEAKILWGLTHPSLPSFTGFFLENQRYFLVMEFIDGFTLEHLLERNGAPLPEHRVLDWAGQLCDALEYLHNQHPPIIFRDMKPSNVMLMPNKHIKLIDFGIARFFRPMSSSRDTQILGTPGYAPPEQYGKVQTDERSDIYSLAITLFQLLTDDLPETGFGLRGVHSLNPKISPRVAFALEKAASLYPEDRYNTVTAFKHALLE